MHNTADLRKLRIFRKAHCVFRIHSDGFSTNNQTTTNTAATSSMSYTVVEDSPPLNWSPEVELEQEVYFASAS